MSVDKEIWKDIKGFPNYQVSNHGRVRNKTTGLFLKSALDTSTGYTKVNLFNNGMNQTKSVHRLVAEAFIENVHNKRLVNHIDCDKTNNHVQNLEWATDSENMKHAFANGLCENTRKAAYVQQEILSKKPRTDKQRETARENIIMTNKRPKTEKQLEASRRAINSEKCRAGSKESHINRHPPIKVVETGEICRSQRELAEKLGVDESAICACLHNRRTHANGLHFVYVDNIDVPKPTKQPFLYPHQRQAIDRMFTGCILNGGVGSGKSRTGIYYYFQKYGGSIDDDRNYTPMRCKPKPPDLYIISTSKKRDDKEWEQEMIPFLLSTDPNINKYYGNKIVIDSWQNIKKYDDVTGAFFIFDEDKVTGKGAWAKSFLKITKNNEWIILSATAGDRWEDFETVFIANGFFKNRSEMQREHYVYSRYTKFPKVDRYINEQRLFRLRDKILIDMEFKRHTIPHHEDVYVQYDIPKYKDAIRNRWDPFKNEPIEQAAGLCYTLRRIVNEDESRQVALLELLEQHPKAIIFYNFDYELDILLKLGYQEGTKVAQYNGHIHEPIPNGDRWVYLVNYNACEAWNSTTTDCMVFFSQNYSYKIMVQASGRIDRLSTPFTDLYYYHLKSRSGIDLAINKALKNKKKFNEKKWVGWD